MQEHRALKWIGGILLGLSLVLVLVVALFDWNWLRDPIASGPGLVGWIAGKF